MRHFFARMLDSKDSGVEFHTLAAVILLMAMIVFSGWADYWHPETWSVDEFCKGGAWILGAFGVAGTGTGLQRMAQGPGEPPAGS